VSRGQLEADAAVGSDLDAVLDIIYREKPDFDYSVFKYQGPSDLSLVTGLKLGLTGYSRHGVINNEGRPADLPLEYPLGIIQGEGGILYDKFCVKGGYWFAGIWTADAESLVESKAQVLSVLRRNEAIYGNVSRDVNLSSFLSLTPHGGYRVFRTRGKLVVKVSTGEEVGWDYTTRYAGWEIGGEGTLTPPWLDIVLSAGYGRVFCEPGYNIGELKVGTRTAEGTGTYVFGRWLWGEPFRYTTAGFAISLKFPL